jgi:hypothetical protein
MVNYKCPRCGYETHIKTIYVRHLERKLKCKPNLSDTNLVEEYIKYDIKYTKKEPQKNRKKPQNDMLPTAEKPQKTAENIQILVENTKCKYCGKIFLRKDSLPRHLRSCKEKKKDDEDKKNLLDLVNLLNKQLEEQREQLNKKDKQIEELIKKSGINIGTQNVQQNINILAYKDTDISHLTDNDYLKCLKHSNFCIPHLIEKIHFNPKKPENHNIYISNLKNNYVMIYDGHKWNIKDRDESIQDLIDEKEVFIEQKLEEWIENGNQYPDIMKKFNRYLEKKENDKVLNKIKTEIKFILFNNRDLICK